MQPANPQRTVTLTERVATECKLTPADIEFLVAEHRGHLELAPTGRRHRYRLTPRGRVGVIVAPHCRLLIRPKLPLVNFLHLLDPTDPLPAAEDQTTAVRGGELLDFLAARLARLLAERAVAGLHRGYAERSDQGAFLQGRLDVPAQLRDAATRKDRLHSRYDDFTVDVPCNQVPRATAELIVRSPLLSDAIRAALRQELCAFGEVSPVALGRDSFLTAAPDRLTAAYRPLLDLCRLLADSLAPGPTAGGTACPAFLIDTERVFERYVTNGVVRAFPEGGRYRVSVQPWHVANQPSAGQPDIQMRPDLTLDEAGRSVLIVDAKWKRLPAAGLFTDDAYQVLAYCTALDVPRAVLVYPGRRSRVWRYRLARSPISLEIRTLRVRGRRELCDRALKALGRALQPHSNV